MKKKPMNDTRIRKMRICDRKKCKNCLPICKYTLDPMHALYDEEGEYTLRGEYLWEQEPKRGEMVSRQSRDGITAKLTEKSAN